MIDVAWVGLQYTHTHSTLTLSSYPCVTVHVCVGIYSVCLPSEFNPPLPVPLQLRTGGGGGGEGGDNPRCVFVREERGEGRRIEQGSKE